jgi:hypothetical protein
MIEDVFSLHPLPFTKPEPGDVWAEDVNRAANYAADVVFQMLPITQEEWDDVNDVLREKLNQLFKKPCYRSYH